MSQRAAGRWFVLLLAGLTLVPFLPALMSGQVLIFRDHADYFVPLRWFTTARLLAGELPWWNPFNGSGELWLANPQTAVFYPPALLFLVFPFALAYVAFLALHLFLLAFFTFRLFSRFASSEAALFGAIAATFSGPLLSLVDVQNNLATLCWIPFAIDVASRDTLPPLRRIALLALAFALMFLGGEPFYTAVGGAIVAAVAFARCRFRALGELTVAGALALLIAAPQLLPFLQSLRGSDRVAGLSTELALRNSLPAIDWLLVFVPAWRSTQNAASQHFIVSLYAGCAVLAFAFLGIVASRSLERRQRRVLFAAGVVIVVSLLYALGANAGWVEQSTIFLRLNLSRYPARILPFAAIGLAAIAAIGWDRMRTAAVRGERLAVMLLLAAGGAFALRRGAPLPTLADLAFALLVVAAAAWLRSKVALRAAVIGIAGGGLIAAHAALFTSSSIDALKAPYAAVVDRDSNIVRLSSAADLPRAFDVAGKREWMSGYLNLFAGVHDVSTPAPVVSVAMMQVHDSAVSAANRMLIQRLSLGTVLSARTLQQPQLRPLLRAGRVLLYRNDAALPMITLWREPSHCVSAEAGVARLLRRDVLESICVVDGLKKERPSSLVGVAAARFDGTARVVAWVEAESPSLVALNQNDADGWSVQVDGADEKKVLVDGIFRGVFVERGKHLVEWRFTPPRFRLALFAAFVGITIAATLAATKQRAPSSRER